MFIFTGWLLDPNKHLQTFINWACITFGHNTAPLCVPAIHDVQRVCSGTHWPVATRIAHGRRHRDLLYLPRYECHNETVCNTPRLLCSQWAVLKPHTAFHWTRHLFKFRLIYVGIPDGNCTLIHICIWVNSLLILANGESSLYPTITHAKSCRQISQLFGLSSWRHE